MSDNAASEFASPLLYGAGLGLLAVIVSVGLTFAGGDQSEPTAQTEQQVSSAEHEPPAQVVPRFDPAAIEKAKTALRAEPKVVDLAYDESLEVEWNVAVRNDGSPRHGYAGYLCLVLDDFGVVDDKTKVRIVGAAKVRIVGAAKVRIVGAAKVRIVGAAKVTELGDAFRYYEMGTVHCRSGDRFG
jgi:hypothetical protein